MKTSELSKSSILELSVIAGLLGVDIEAINKRNFDRLSDELLTAVTNKLAKLKVDKIEVPSRLKSYVERKGILLSV